MNMLASLEAGGFATWIRESGSLFGYAGVLTAHTIGLAVLVGVSAVVDLRILGVGRRIPLRRLAGCYPLLWAGFALNAVSGLVLFLTDATRRATQPIFYIKLLLIALALGSVWLLRRLAVDGRPAATPSRQVRSLAVVSLVLWAGAITAGRLMAYVVE